MIPAYLLRAGIDWVRHNQDFKDFNPNKRCEQCIKTVSELFEEQVGSFDPIVLESAVIATYFAEFFHAEDSLPRDAEWRDGLIKQSRQHNAFESWQEWFKSKFAKVYKDDNIWLGLVMASWAHTHQYELSYTEDAWEFLPATSYLRTEQLFRLDPHMESVAEILREIWKEEVEAYRASGFNIDEYSIPFLGNAECIGFDTRRYSIIWPPRAHKESEDLELGETIADIILPASDNWYRQLDPVIFVENYVDVSSLYNRAQYVFKSRRRLYELSVDSDSESARMRAAAEGWLVPEPEPATPVS
jgi:hypothetical protein